MPCSSVGHVAIPLVPSESQIPSSGNIAGES